MIDIHCHILPMFDDGASSLDDALAMARQAVDSGVTDIVATPHFPGVRRTLQDVPAIFDRYDLLCDAIEREKLPLKLHLGSEVHCRPQTPELARQGALLTIAETPYLLTEFHFGESFAYMDEMLGILWDYGYYPVVAHPERYDAIQRQPRLLEHWFRRGFILQMNKGSVLGSFGDLVEETAHWMLDYGFVHMIASDGHSPHRRTTQMKELHEWLLNNYEEEYVRMLLEENPARLLRGESMTPIGRI